MAQPDAFSHCVTQAVKVPAEKAYAFLADGLQLGRWSFGCWDSKAAGDGLFTGHSLFDGGKGYVRIDGDAKRLIIDWHVGGSPDRMTPRIMARVIPGPRTARGADECLVTMTAWRDQGMDDGRWQRLVACHETEIILIKSLMEAA